MTATVCLMVTTILLAAMSVVASVLDGCPDVLWAGLAVASLFGFVVLMSAVATDVTSERKQQQQQQ